jgi:predicted rRNA methylase YqxC with S4 and FtsJ domains
MGACSFIFLKETKPDSKNKESTKKEKVVLLDKPTFKLTDERGKKSGLV